MEISPEALKMLLASVRENTAALVEAIGAPSGRIALSPGEEVRGEVLEQRPSGSYLVKIGGAPFDMKLPSSTRVGTTVQMTYVTDQPRLTFVLSTSGSRESQVTLSSAGRWLGATAGNLQAAQEQPHAATITSVRLFDKLPVDTQAIARRLQETITRSGLFYESHLVRWSQGDYPQELILQEPQGKLSPQLPGNPPAMQLPLEHASVQQPLRSQPPAAGDQAAAGTESGRTEPTQKAQPPAPQQSPESPDLISPRQTAEQVRATVVPSGPVTDAPPPISQPAAAKGADNAQVVTPAPEQPQPPQMLPPAESDPVAQQPIPPGAQSTGGAKLPADSPGQVLPHQTAAGPSLAQPPIEPATPERSVPTESRQEEPARNVTPQPPPVSPPDLQGSRLVTPQPGQAGQLLNATAADGAEQTLRTDDSIASRSTQAAATTAQPLGETHDNRTLPLVKEQLATLNSGQIVWQGEAWKGQELEWKITREQKQRGHAVARSWATDLSMELPELGTVSARIRLTGNQIHLSLNGEREETLQRMRQGTAKLSEALESAGMQLARVEVERVEPPAG
jgi:hypothetical protein